MNLLKKTIHPISIVISFLLLTFIPANTQTNQISIVGTEVSNFSKIQENRVYDLYKMEIKRNSFKKDSQKNINPYATQLTISLGEREWQIDLFETDLISQDLLSKYEKQGITPPITYEGFTDKGEAVRLSINDGFIYGYIIDNAKTFYIEPATYISKSAKKNEFAIYDSEEAMTFAQNTDDVNLTCGSHLLASKKSIDRGLKKLPSGLAKIACQGVKIAIGSDHTMYSRYGSTQGVSNHNIGVMNNVQGDYDGMGSGSFDIEFTIVAEYTATIESQNPYATIASNDIGVLLPEFSSWAISNGFGVGITPGLLGGGTAGTMAQLWSAKSLNYQGQGNVIGLAYTPGNFCVLEDYSGVDNNGTAWGLRVLTSHEMGHNFSANHDSNCGAGNCIMYPSVSGNTSTWTAQSISSIQSNINGRALTGCFSSCSNGIQDLGELGIDCGGVCAPCPCSVAETYASPLSLTITFDQYAVESSWDIRNSADAILHNASYTAGNNNSTVTINNLNIDPANGISFNFYDSYGDGICCLFGNGSYTLKDANNVTIATGGTFSSSVSHVFCISSEDPCTNGMQDNGEQAVDCGGSCTPCITGCLDANAHNYNATAQVDDGSCQTCSDNTLNGDEVAVDCGGSCTPCITGCTDVNAHNYDPTAVITNNSLCLTCNDGIQNGDESDVDCGGKKCSPCDCTETNFTSGNMLNSDVTVHAQNDIISNDTINSNLNVMFIAGNSISLNAGFEVMLNAVFEARIEGCN